MLLHEMLPSFRTFALPHCFILSRLSGMWIMGGSEVMLLDNRQNIERQGVAIFHLFNGINNVTKVISYVV